jgi:predicted dehydrogenase
MFSSLIIGCGQIAGGRYPLFQDGYGPAINRTDGLRLGGCVDREQRRADSYSRLYGGGSWSDADEALKTLRPDLVVIATPDDSHFEVARRMLEHDDHPALLVIEKPVCVTQQEMSELVRIASDVSTRIVVNHSRRFHPWFSRLKEQIAVGTFGSFVELNATYYGGWKHNGVHVVDTLRYLAGSDIEISTSMIAWPFETNDDVTLSARGHLVPSGCPVNLSGFDGSRYQIFEFDLRFEEYRIRIDDFRGRYTVDRVVESPAGERLLEEVAHPIEGNMGGGMDVLLTDCVRFLSTRDPGRLSSATIFEAELTMNSIWQGMEASCPELI